MEDNEDPNLIVEVNGSQFSQGFKGNGTPLTRDQLNHLTERICFSDDDNYEPIVDDLEAGVRINFLGIQFKDIPKYLGYLKGMHSIILRYRLEIGI